MLQACGPTKQYGPHITPTLDISEKNRDSEI